LKRALRLSPRSRVRRQHTPADVFLRSLAEERQEEAIAVILSGNTSDGSYGIRAIKAEGGIVFAQDEHSTKYAGLPQSAVATGCVDFMLPPDRIAGELLRISRQPYPSPAKSGETAGAMSGAEDNLNQIFSTVRIATGVDFTLYKRTTVKRRIMRRMLLHRMDDIEAYTEYLKENPSEVNGLSQDLMIKVTSFFREPGTFSALKKLVFPSITRKASTETPVRIWVPACSTGEEAYSIAICLKEFSDEKKLSLPFQIFGTDIDEAALMKARKGVFPVSISSDVSPERLKRFFIKSEGGYRINTSIREMCIFGRQNLIEDPPLSKVDFVSCRNMLIYFGPLLQKRTMPIFHYALKPAGFLMLGTSETIGEFSSLFSLIDKKSKIYSKKAASARPYGEQLPAASIDRRAAAVKRRAATVIDIRRESDKIVLKRFCPAGVVINKDMKVLELRGDTSPYLAPAHGAAGVNLREMVREGIAARLLAAIRKAAKDNLPVRSEGVRVIHNRRARKINIEVVPFMPTAAKECYFLVLFEEPVIHTYLHDETGHAVSGGATLPLQKKGRRQMSAKEREEEDKITLLTNELAATKEHLRTIICEHEISNDEFQSFNEELQSRNEELQCINEELETAKEEIQSTNDELTTVNDELQSRNLELAEINNDLINVLSGVEIPVLFLGTGLQIRRFNSAAAKLLNLIPSDAGRPITDIRTNICVPELSEMILSVIGTAAMHQQEITDRDGRWYSMTIRPYKALDNSVDGVLITFVDIHEIKLNSVRLKEARDYAEAIVETVSQPLVVLDADLRVITANTSFHRKFRTKPEATENCLFYDLEGGRWNIPRLRILLEGVSARDEFFENVQVDIEFRNAGRRIMLLNARRISRGDHQPQMILLAMEDITERKKIEERLFQANRFLSLLGEAMPVAFYVCKAGGDLAMTYISDNIKSLTGFEPEEFTSDPSLWTENIHPDDKERVIRKLSEIFREGTFEHEYRWRVSDGSYRWFYDVLQLVHSPEDGDSSVVGTFIDITKRKKAEEEMRIKTVLLETASDAILLLDQDANFLYFNTAFIRMTGYPREELAARRLHDIEPPEFAEKIQDNIAMLLLQGEAVFESAYQRKDGTVVPVEVHALVISLSGRQVILSAVRDITERKRVENVLSFLAHCGTSPGEDFFESLALYLAGSLGMDFVCIDRLEGDLLTARTVAVYFDGKFEDNVSYTLHDTPCGEVVGKDVCCFPSGVCRLFPRDVVLQDMKAESYVGVTLWSHSGQPIGLIAVIGRKPLENPRAAESILKMVAVRAAAELERRQADESLLASEERLNQAQQIAHLGSWELDLTANRLIWSDEVYRMFGLLPREFPATYEAFLETVHPGDRAAVDAAYSGSLREGRNTYEIEHRIVRRHTGEVRHVHEKCEHIRDETGRIIRSIGMVQDITERKQTEEALRKSNSFNQSIIDSSNDCIKILDMEGRLQYMSPAGQHVLGIEDIGKYLNIPYEEFWRGTDHRAALEAIRKARQGLSGSFQGYCPTVNGAPKWWDVAITPVVGADGRPERLLAVSRDITERKLAEEELSVITQRHQLALKSGHLGVWDWDVQTGVMFWDDRVLELYGISREAFHASVDVWKEGLHPEDRSRAIAESEAALRGEREFDTEFRVRHPDGTVKTIKANAFVIRDADGNPRRMIGLNRDITEQRRAEDELRRTVRQLHCLYRISSLAGIPGITEEEILRGIVELTPKALHHPERVCARVVFENAEFKTGDFRETACRLTADVAVNETRAGVLEVCSFKETTAGEEDPFLDEERKLIDAVALQLGVIIARLRIEEELRRSHHDLEVRIAERSEELIRNNILLAAISGAQSRLISECEPQEIFEGMLTEILAITDSEYGFMGRVLTTPEGKPYLKMYATKDIAWSDETRMLYEQNAAKGLEFHNLDTLFGAVLKTGRPVISNDPERDPQRGGLPHGHPQMRSFMGIPVYSGSSMVAMLGIANRPNGYREAMIEFLQPLLSTCATISEALHMNQNRKKAEEELRFAYRELQYRQMEIEALLESARAALKYRDFRDVARAIFNLCKDLTGSTGGYVALLSGDGTQNEVIYLDSGGRHCTVDPSLPMPVRGLREMAYRNGRGVFHNSFRDSEWMKFIPEGHAPIENVLFSPLIIRGKAVGLFGLANKHGGFSEADVHIAAAFCDIAVIAYSNSRTSRELQESEKRYKTLVQSVTDYIYSVEIKNGVPTDTKHGPGCVAVTGYSSVEFKGDPYLWYLTIHEEDRAAVLQQANNIISGERIDPVEHRIRHKDGSVRWVKNTVVRRFDESGRLTAYDGLVSDITERKHFESALQESENRYRTLFELATDAIFILDAEGEDAGRIVAANHAAACMHGYTVDELVEMNIAELYPPETAEEIPAIFRQILKEGFVKTELYHRKKDGEPFPVEKSAGLLELEGRKYVLVFDRDVTERKKAEDERDRLIGELQEALSRVSRSQKEWLDTFDSITDHISIIDKDFTILKANRSFSCSYGFHPRDIIGKKCYEVVHGLHAPVENCPHATTLQELIPVTREVLDPKTTGIFRVSTYPYHSPEGDFIGSIHIAKDITLEKEKELQFIRSEKLASLGQLSAGMAHEINNPINFIMANAHLLSGIWKDVLKILRLHYEDQGDFLIGGFSFSN
ncbi:MAG: PAS domain S-box protein, partial [Nitrospirota bacterium]|nr:PAS domain S-box protein [Nitrospirota bacterium]